MNLLLRLILSVLLSSHTDLHATVSQGQQFGREMMQKSGNVATSVNPSKDVPQYTSTPPEAALTDRTLEDRTRTSLVKNPAAQLVQTNEQARGKFLNLQEDPLITLSQNLSRDPLGLLSRFYENCREVPSAGKTPVQESEEVTCEQSGLPYPMGCIRTLQVKVTEKKKIYVRTRLWGKIADQFLVNPVREKYRRHLSQYYRHGAIYDIYVDDPTLEDNYMTFCSRRKGFFNQVKNEYRYTRQLPGQAPVSISREEYEDKTLKPEDIEDYWSSGCDHLEGKVDSGLCQYADVRCTQGPEARLINGVSVFRECWQKSYTYHCQWPARNDCEALHARGCHQIRSRCQKSMGRDCVLYRQTFQCFKPLSGDSQGVSRKLVCGKAPLCLSGDCVDQSYPVNTEMLEALSRLSIFKELQNQIKDGVPEIFKGEDERCSRSIVGFKDCCGRGSGWGVSLHFASCSKEEKALCLKRQKRQCHRVGTYCSKKEKISKVCLEKKTTFCCFGSSFLRTLQEQARAQISLGWGSARQPVCRGLTIEEISRVDFSKLDLREIFSELTSRYKPPQVEALGEKIQSRMSEIQNSLKTDPQALQRKEGA